MGGGHINPVDLLANVSTGGLYEAGKDLSKGQIGSAAENLGPWGSAVHPISPQIADAGNLAGAGAGIGAGLASSGTAAFNPATGTGAAAGSSIDPAYFGFDEATIQALGSTPYNQFSGVPASGLSGGPSAGLFTPGQAGVAGSPGGTSGTGALVGASLAQQLAGLFGGASPLAATPQGGGATGGAGQLTPQQIAALTAAQSEAHRGLAPAFEARQGGKSPGAGIAGSSYTS